MLDLAGNLGVPGSLELQVNAAKPDLKDHRDNLDLQDKEAKMVNQERLDSAERLVQLDPTVGGGLE